MQKKLLALAVAGAFAAPVAMAQPTVYGNIALSIDSVDGGNTSAATIATATAQLVNSNAQADERYAQNIARAMMNSGESRLRVTSNNSFLGIKGNEKLTDDLSAVYQWEFSVNFDQQDTGNLGANDAQTTQSKRNTFAGLSSKAAGAVTLGLQDTPLKVSTGKYDYFGNTVADYRTIIGAMGSSVRAQNSVMYTSPKMAGVEVRALWGTANETGNGSNNDARPRIFSASVGWEDKMFSVIAAYEKNNVSGTLNDIAAGAASTPVQNPVNLFGGAMNAFFQIFPSVATANAAQTSGYTNYDAELKSLRVGAGVNVAGFKAALAYEKNEADAVARYTAGTSAVVSGGTGSFDATADRKAYHATAGYTFGNTTVMGAYTVAKDFGGTWFAGLNDTGAKQYSVGVSHNLSKNTSLFGFYTKVKNEQNGTYGLAGGATGIAGVTVADIGEDPSAISIGTRIKF